MKKIFIILNLILINFSILAEVKYKDVKPLIDKYCVSCHGPEKAKARLRMDQLNPDMINGHDTEMWQEALDLINISEMPTDKAKLQPTRAERQKLVEWLTKSLRKATVAKRSNGGKNVMRRLTSYEYNNTMRDLLGLDIQYAKDLPPESAAKEGFVNNSTELLTSAIHLEYFENIARNSLTKIIKAPKEKPPLMRLVAQPENILKFGRIPTYGEGRKQKLKEKELRKKGISIVKKKVEIKAGEVYSATVEPEIQEGIKRFEGIRNIKYVRMTSTMLQDIRIESAEILEGKGILLAGDIRPEQTGRSHRIDRPQIECRVRAVPSEAPFTIIIKAAAVRGKDGSLPILSFGLGTQRGNPDIRYVKATEVEVSAPLSAPQTYEFTVRPENFPFVPMRQQVSQYIRVTNEFFKGTSSLTNDELPKLFIDSVEFRFNDYKMWPSAQKQRILFDSPNKTNERVYIKEVLGKFMKRAFRRPVTAGEIEPYASFFNKLRLTDDFESATITTLTAMLCSSNFLFLVEPGNENKRPLNDFELASRLSYFFWSSMPDDELYRLASNKQLSQPGTLKTQISRMLDDPKAFQFVKNFTSQWLDIEAVYEIAVNPQYFKFDDKMKSDFQQETIHFVNEIFKNNLSITNFIDSKFTILSPSLAQHYSIKDYFGGIFKKFPASKAIHRGGLLTHASMLLANSNGGDTNPIKRGVWLLERLLNDPPPPPPPDVPELPEVKEKSKKVLSLKERLEEHAQIESCHDCHSKIDPWGLAFENYNALGQWRQGNKDLHVKKRFQKVISDPSTTLRNGREIKNLNALKNYILSEKREQFTKAVITKVMAYALGRHLEFSDQEAVNKIATFIKDKDLKFKTLIEQVALSEPFLTK